MPEGTINGEPYSVPEGSVVIAESYAEKAKQALTLLQELDRNETGRHEGDSDFNVEGGVSLGNPFLKPGTRIGTHISGKAIIVPPWPDLGNPDAWYQDKEE